MRVGEVVRVVGEIVGEVARWDRGLVTGQVGEMRKVVGTIQDLVPKGRPEA